MTRWRAGGHSSSFVSKRVSDLGAIPSNCAICACVSPRAWRVCAASLPWVVARSMGTNLATHTLLRH